MKIIKVKGENNGWKEGVWSLEEGEKWKGFVTGVLSLMVARAGSPSPPRVQRGTSVLCYVGYVTVRLWRLV